jgi:hypothetical protein
VTTTAALTQRQRTPPPIDRWSARRGTASGGVDRASPRTLAHGLVDNNTRDPETRNDVPIRRARMPFFRVARVIPPGDSFVNWTAAGPARPELHMRNASLRTMVGNTASRYPVVPGTPTSGMHTMTPPGVARTMGRYATTPQIVPGRFNRLSPGQNSGQTYSQTTRLQGNAYR